MVEYNPVVWDGIHRRCSVKMTKADLCKSEFASSNFMSIRIRWKVYYCIWFCRWIGPASAVYFWLVPLRKNGHCIKNIRWDCRKCNCIISSCVDSMALRQTQIEQCLWPFYCLQPEFIVICSIVVSTEHPPHFGGLSHTHTPVLITLVGFNWAINHSFHTNCAHQISMSGEATLMSSLNEAPG